MGGGDLALKVVLQAKDAASGVVKGFGSTLVDLAGKYGPLLSASFAVAGAIVAIGVASVQMAAQYQQQMNMVQALTGSNTQQMAYYDQQVKALAVDAGVAPAKLASGLYNVLSASYTGADAMRILTLATQDAKIGLTDAATTSNALTNVLRTFNISAKDATRVNGEMLTTVTLGKATFGQYASNITKAASSSKQFGLSMETMNAAWATMTSSGISAGQATTDYTQAVGVMYSNIGTVTKSLAKNGIAFNEAKFNAMNFGDKVKYLNSVLQIAAEKHIHITGVTKQAAQGIKAISDHLDNYKSNLAKLSDKQAMSQKTAQAWAITQSGLSQQMDRAKAAVQVLFIDIGQKLLPVITKIVSAVAPAIQGLMNFASAVSHNQVAMALIEAALITFAGVILAVLIPALVAWAIEMGTVAVENIIAMWPIYLVVLIIIAVIAAVILIIKNWGAIANWLKGVWGAIASFFVDLWNKVVAGLKLQIMVWMMVWNAIVKGLQSAWAWIVGIVQAGLAFLVNMFTAPFRAIGALFSWLFNHNYYFHALVLKIQQIVQIGLAWLRAAWQNVVNWLANLWHGIAGIATTAWNALKAAIMTIVLAIGNWEIQQWTKATQWLSDKWNSFAGLATKAWQLVSGVFTSIWSKYISGPLTNLWNSISGWFKNLASTAISWGQNLIQGFLKGIQNMLGQVGKVAGNVASTVGKFLGFHSPAAEGEGRYIIEWGQGLVKGFSSGVIGAIPTLQAAVNMAVHNGTAPMQQSFSGVPYGRPPSGNSYSSIAGGNTHNGDIIIHAPAGMDIKALANEIERRQNSKYRRSGVFGDPSGGVRSI